MAAFKLVYVTGAPASGKTSTMALLRERIPAVKLWEYGARLTEFLRSRGEALQDQEDLRRRSGGVVRPSDIEVLDKELLRWAAESRSSFHTVVDSHPVTKEEYGFRSTAFSAERLKLLHPDEIWLFYVAPEVTLERISENAAGRPSITIEEARMHSEAQVCVACTYGIIAGCPVYMFDTGANQSELVDRLAARLEI